MRASKANVASLGSSGSGISNEKNKADRQYSIVELCSSSDHIFLLVYVWCNIKQVRSKAPMREFIFSYAIRYRAMSSSLDERAPPLKRCVMYSARTSVLAKDKISVVARRSIPHDSALASNK